MQLKRKFVRYRPLFVLVFVALLGAIALSRGRQVGFLSGMHFFMGLVFCQFSMLKLFHLSDFVRGFQKYDLVAKRFITYGYVYPFIELGLGLAYLSFACSVVTYIVTIAVTLVGTIGVVRALQAGLDTRCACMGTMLDVPISTVTLSEDIAMGIMACLMLIFTFV